MYCSNCGAYNDDNSNFCGYCGQSVQNNDVADENQTLTIPQPVIINNDILIKPELQDGYFFKGIGFFKKLGIYAIGVFLFFMIAAIVFASNYPDYMADAVSYISRFVY